MFLIGTIFFDHCAPVSDPPMSQDLKQLQAPLPAHHTPCLVPSEGELLNTLALSQPLVHSHQGHKPPVPWASGLSSTAVLVGLE